MRPAARPARTGAVCAVGHTTGASARSAPARPGPGQVAELCLDKLKNPQKAYALVRRRKCQTKGALRVAKHAQAAGDTMAAVEFLVIAGAPPPPCPLPRRPPPTSSPEHGRRVVFGWPAPCSPFPLAYPAPPRLTSARCC